MKAGQLKKVLVAVGCAAVASVASAADCSVYTTSTSGGAAQATPSVLNTTNVKLNGVNSDDCAGHYDFADSSLATSVTFANGGTGLFGHTDWLGAAKIDPSSAETATWSGLKFELVSVSGYTTGGSFTIKVTDTNSNAPANLPATMDFAIMLSKGANVNDFYFFDDEVVNATNAGLFTVGFTNNPGGNNATPSLQNLSHINLLVRDIRSGPACQPGDTSCQVPSVPEPGSLALAVLALAGMGLWMRRRTR
jgi:PEP-CTERM motif